MGERFHGRTRGSVRFAPYFKIGWYDTVSLVWREIQQQYPTPAAASAGVADYDGHTIQASRSEHVLIAIPAGSAWRTIEVSERGRRIVS